MGVAPAPLVGRAEELALLDAALADLMHGEWKSVELVGDPGIGKTRLLEELATLASHRGQLVLSGAASELERDLPFWVFVNALDDYVRSLDPRLLDLVDADALAELANVFPSLSRPTRIVCSSTSATAPIVRYGSCWNGWRQPGRWC